uniref:Amine oxidase n=1 Tax=Arion vulgaris TaxID=1028688 RepID=A0A0B7ACG4_9EUPU
MKRSSRPVKPNSKYFNKCGTSPEDPKRKCERSGCTATVPICFARVSDRCTGSGWTSRWYHLTLGEHYCNECFEYYYRSHKDGYKEYDQWKREWSAKARTEAGISPFMVEQILPYWVQCKAVGCGKWRQLSRDLNLTPEFIDTFVCGRPSVQGQIKKEKQDGCSIPEDERVHYVRSPLWLVQNKCTPFLKKSPAAPFLTSYYADGVGLSPTEDPVELSKEDKKKLCPYVVPFLKGDYPLHAFTVMPDMMLDMEIDSFPLIAQECPYLYLAMRNLILALWALNPKEWVTQEKCMRHIICRGLPRVSCIDILPQILSALTYHNFINQGLVTPPASLRCHTQESVIVVGAGASGVGAAHLLHSHGVQVTVLEAKSMLGGRVNDIEINGAVISTSGQLLNGCANNPIAIIAFQAGIDIEEQKNTCQLVNQHGQLVDDKIDRRMEFHYNAILDIVSEWRKNKTIQQDVPLIQKVKEFHEEFVTETQGYFSQGLFSQEEEQVMDFYLSNLEYSCGCSLSQLSSLHWDQNEEMPQFGGSTMTIPQGYGSILSKLAEGLDVRYSCQVTDINYNGSSVIVNTTTGSFTADKVIVTLPLSVLKSHSVTFHPHLPQAKLKAINSLGVGHVEKVILQFDENFWSEKITGQRLFGQVPASESQRGLFNTFYPSSCTKSGKHTLSTYIVGHGLKQMAGQSEEQIVQACMQVLKTIFPEKNIPAPVWSHVTNWSKDKYVGIAYSYIPVGAEGVNYDLIADNIEEKVYFAGEATNRQFPQTVTGAYLSGVREARKIIDLFS